MFKLKRVYEQAKKEDGFRVLVDRLWPRGVSKEKAAVELWLKEVGPSNSLRKWFNHDQKKWQVFKEKYRQELRRKEELLEQLMTLEKEHKTLTLIYSATDREHNQALVLAEFLKESV